MKFWFFSLALLFLATPFKGISQNSEMELFQKVFEKEKRDLFEAYLLIEPEEGKKLWPIYDAYEVERKSIGERRFKLLQTYLKNYDNLSGSQISSMVKEMQGIKKKSLALENKYFKKIQKAINPKVAGQFLQFEDYILTLLRSEMYYEINFIQ